MKAIPFAAALAAFAATTAFAQDVAVPADTSPRTTTLIYVVPGVMNDPSVSLATAFICHNASTAAASVNITVRTGTGVVSGTRTFSILPTNTVTVSTRFTNLYFEAAELGSGVVRQGRALIAANSRSVHCSAHVANTTSTFPNTIDLHMVRYNPATNSTE
jgi:hypothetical protein